MPIISANLIRNPRAWRSCASLGCQRSIRPGSPTIRLYGTAETGDPPYVVYFHIDCAAVIDDPKVQAVVKLWKEG